MNYEELDVGGAQRHPAPALSGAPVDVLALDDAPDPALTNPPRPSGWLRQRRPGPPRRTNRRRAGLLVAAATVLGLVAGTALAGHHDGQLRRAEARASVSALATVADTQYVVTDHGKEVDVHVRVYNLGAHPFDIVTNGPDVASPLQSARFHMGSGTGTVKPSEDQTVISRILLDCQSVDPLRLTVHVRGPDGRGHALPVRWEVAGVPELNQEQVCGARFDDESAAVDPLIAELQGSLAAPRLRLANQTGEAMSVILDPESSLNPSARQGMALTTVPALPVSLPAHGTVLVRIRLEFDHCPRSTEDPALAAFPGLELRTDDLTTAGASVNLHALLPGALARACQ